MEPTESGDPAASEHVTITNVVENNYGEVNQYGQVHLMTGLDEPTLNRLFDGVDERWKASGGVRRKSLPPSLPWTPGAACLGRDRELAELREQLAAGRHVLVGGPAGIGKTLLLLHAGAEGILAAETVPRCEGVLRRMSGLGMTPEGVLDDLALECFDAEPAAARHLLGRVRALVVLDGVEWSAEEIRQVLVAMPGSVFVIASRRTVSASVIKCLPLAGLSVADGLELWANELGTPLGAAEKRLGERIFDSCDGNPGTLTEYAAALRTAGVQGIAHDVDDPGTYAVVVDRALAQLGEPAVTTLKELLVFPGVFWGEGLLAPAGLRKLEAAQLVEHTTGRYRVRPHVAGAVAPADPPWPLFARLTRWAHEDADAGQIAAELGVLERTLRRLLDHDRPWDALVLARIVSVKLLPTPWWHRGDEVLELGLRAARRARSRTDIAFFTYALAARRADSERVAEAAELLTALIDAAREHGDRQLADRAGALRDGLPGRGPGVLGRSADTVSQLVLRVPVLDGTAFRLAQEHPALLRNAVGMLLLAGVLFGLPASAGPPASATGAPSSPSGLAAPMTPPATSVRPSAGAPPSGQPAPPAPPPAPPSPGPAARPSPPPGPAGKFGASTDGTADPAQRPTTTAAPDLTGQWRIVFSQKRVNGRFWTDPDTATITLHRLDAVRCGGPAPCYGGQWTDGGSAGSSNFVARAAPGATGFSATDSDADGNQTFRGSLVSADPQLRYDGEWSDDRGREATFVFTRLS
ncbi:ATP-binding protein [Amycolatopsis vancoresmycina]|uniref:ATP-binding protein n=1 Tax=Amycolatopsis vancoresmycina TaxID=208444 RepID=UPI0005260B09|nr:ATP-binding protein [Amycolatopsis vancoresmycina]